MAQENVAPALDSTDFDEFKRAVEAAAKGEIDTSKVVTDDDDDNTGQTDDNTGNETGNDDGGEGGEGGETAEEKAAREAAEKAAKEKAKTPRKSVSERIAEFRRSLTDAQEVAAIEAAEAERLRRENEELKKKLDGGTEKPGAKQKVTYQRLDGEPDPAKYEFGVIDPAYQRDLTKFFVEADRKAAQEAAAQENEAAEGQKKFLDTVQRGLEKYDDYLQVVVQGADQGKWRLTPVAAQTIVDSEFGHEIAYHLANNPAEAADIADLPPHRQAAAIGRLEARFAAEAEAANDAGNGGEGGDDDGAQTQQKPAPKTATRAPAPPANRNERASGGEFKASPDTKDLNAYRRLVEKHQQGR